MQSQGAKSYFLRLAIVGAGYTAVAYLSLFLVPAGSAGASIVWPPSAIGLAALFIFGYELWPALLVPFFLLMVARGVAPPVALSVSLGDMLEALAGAWILKRFAFLPMLNRLQDAMLFLATSFGATLVSASIITGALHLLNNAPTNQELWLGLWLGHSVSLISFGIFAVRWGCKPLFTRTKAEWLEGTVLFTFFLVTSVLAYWTPYGSIGEVSVLYISIIALIWGALRSGPRGMTLMVMLMALIAATGTIYGFGPVAHSTAAPQQVLFSIQLVVGILSLIFILFTVIVEERKEAVIALRSNVDRLEVAVDQISREDQAKSDFIAILAHELRNPLSPILSSIEIMRQNGVSEQNRAPVASIGSHVHVLARLLDDLLDMSRITQKKFKLQREPVKLSTIIAQSIEMAAPHISERSHTLSVTEPQEDVWLDGDPVRLGQILINLLSNAIKYTDPGGTVRLSARREGNEAVVEISDTGIGIDPSRLKKIFEPFGAADVGARREGGLHIGLSLARRMAELHQGRLEATSRGAGGGSTFVVRLPVMPTAPLLAAPAAVRSRFSPEALAQTREALGALTVLVVDDNEAAADSLSTLLTHNGHKTLVAYDAPQALALCENNTPGVALLDIGLPTMDGYELARILRKKFGGNIMLVALTGYGQQEDKQKAADAGFDNHLTKPVSIVDVERVLLQLSRR